MKNLIFCVLLGLLALTGTRAAAQFADMAYMVKGEELTEDTVAKFKLFTARRVEGRNYLHWNVCSQHADGVYIIYRSPDGINYSRVGKKIGVGVPVPYDIAYYFTDEFNCKETVYYKILHVSREHAFILSGAASVNVDPGRSFSSAK